MTRTVDGGRLGRGLSFARRRQLFLLLLGTPAVVYVAVVGVMPLLQGAWYSLFDYNLTHPGRRHFVGLGNYVELLSDPSVRAAAVNTLVFTLSAVALEFLGGLGIALLLWRESTFNRICLALLLIPVTVTPIVVGLVFKGLLGADYGVIGYYLAEWGLSSPRGLLGDKSRVLGTLVMVDVWEWTPLVALILLAGLKALPGDVIEAATADGATAWQRFRLIILPLMLPAVFLALTLRMMDAFRVFDSIYVTTGGGPADASMSLMVLAVKQGLEFFNVGTASALANLMLVAVAILAASFGWVIRRADVAINGR